MIIVDLGDDQGVYEVDWARLMVWWPWKEGSLDEDPRSFTAADFLRSVARERAHKAMSNRMRSWMRDKGRTIVVQSFEDRWRELQAGRG